MNQVLRFEHNGQVVYGRRDVAPGGGVVRILSTAPWAAGVPTGQAVPYSEALRLHVPCEPTKIVCIGKNYAAHAAELGTAVPAEPLIFLKPPSSLLPHRGTILRPPASQEVHHEGELALVVGRRARHLSPDQVASALAGVTCANDVTARDIQRAEVQFTRAKSFDTFCAVGPWVQEMPLDLNRLTLRCRVNGQTRQEASTAHMVVDPYRLVAFISSVMTLEPGDLILTGTPAGVGPLRAGDRVEVEIEGVGRLENDVSDA